jgi:hypothetical protein
MSRYSRDLDLTKNDTYLGSYLAAYASYVPASNSIITAPRSELPSKLEYYAQSANISTYLGGCECKKRAIKLIYRLINLT